MPPKGDSRKRDEADERERQKKKGEHRSKTLHREDEPQVTSVERLEAILTHRSPTTSQMYASMFDEIIPGQGNTSQQRLEALKSVPAMKPDLELTSDQLSQQILRHAVFGGQKVKGKKSIATVSHPYTDGKDLLASWTKGPLGSSDWVKEAAAKHLEKDDEEKDNESDDSNSDDAVGDDPAK